MIEQKSENKKSYRRQEGNAQHHTPLAVSARIIVFVDGALTCQLDGDTLTEHELVTALNTGLKPAVSPAA